MSVARSWRSDTQRGEELAHHRLHFHAMAAIREVRATLDHVEPGAGNGVATRRDMATVGKLSSDPEITCTGHRMRAQSASQSLRSKVSWRRARRESTE